MAALLPLTRHSHVLLHITQNVLLLLLCAGAAPFLFVFCLGAEVAAPLLNMVGLTQTSAPLAQPKPSPPQRRRTVLVTGISMAKGLFITRAFHSQGHQVIGADSSTFAVGRFSRSIAKFYQLPDPMRGKTGEAKKAYVDGILEIVQKEKIELWVSCSGVGSAIEDAEAAERMQELGLCKAIQFGVELTATLHEKDLFAKFTARDPRLQTPRSFLITSEKDIVSSGILEKAGIYAGARKVGGNVDGAEGLVTEEHYILKPVNTDDTQRADMTLLPLIAPGNPDRSALNTRQHILRKLPSGPNPFLLQRYIKGREYCTFGLVVKGKLRAFAACESEDMLMRYELLDPNSHLYVAMREYTQDYCRMLGEESGHFSLDFIVAESEHQKHNPDLAAIDEVMDIREEPTVPEWRRRLYAIECNPRAHTAVVLFRGLEKELVNAYLSIMDNYVVGAAEESELAGRNETTSVYTVPTDVDHGKRTDLVSGITIAEPTSPCRVDYWIGHEFLSLVVLPLLTVVLAVFFIDTGIPYPDYPSRLATILSGTDATFVISDPWPLFFLYAVSWPGELVDALWKAKWWSKANVSTMKMFRVGTLVQRDANGGTRRSFRD